MIALAFINGDGVIQQSVRREGGREGIFKFYHKPKSYFVKITPLLLI